MNNEDFIYLDQASYLQALSYLAIGNQSAAKEMLESMATDEYLSKEILGKVKELLLVID